MKGLMPLALSPSSSSSWNNPQFSPREDDDMAERGVDCLPELLARDLEVSAQVFSARNLTAGFPTSSTSHDDKARSRGSRVSLYSPYLAASARVQNLGAIEERESMASFLGKDVSALVDSSSVSTSTSSHTRSEEAEPPSFRHRGSVVTTATSVASHQWKPNGSPAPENPSRFSWADEGLESGEHDERGMGNGQHLFLSPRSPTPPRSRPTSPLIAGLYEPRTDYPGFHAPGLLRTTRRKSHSVSGASPLFSPVSKSPALSTDLPLRSSSTNGSNIRGSSDAWTSGPAPTFSKLYQRRMLKAERPRSTCDEMMAENVLSDFRKQDQMRQSDDVVEPSRLGNYDAFDLDDDVAYPSVRQPTRVAGPAFPRSPTSPEPVRSVQSWLNSSLQPYPWPSANEDSAKVVPLPPDAVETLRVSVACFPETMLLTSSLTVETIRSYAKKMRQPSLDMNSVLAEDAPPQSSRVSLWRKVVTYKRGQNSEPKAASKGLHVRHGSAANANALADDDSKPWLSIQNVFSSCSDYICNALYAHIVAYNYMSALVARQPPPHPGLGRSSAVASVKDLAQQDDIPKKAASLLGIASGPDMAASMSRSSHRLASPLADWTKEGMVTGRTAAPTAQDHALRGIQSGLLRCISRLVATARLMAENGTGEDRMVDLEAEDADMLLIRSLCEMVRMAEECL